MESILLRLLNVTMLSSVIIAVVMLLKALFKNNVSPKAMSLLWFLVLVRLLLPVSIDTPVHFDMLSLEDNIANETPTYSSNSEYVSENTIENNTSDFIFTNDNNYTTENTVVTHVNNELNAEYTDTNDTNQISQITKAFFNKVDFITAAFALWLIIAMLIIAASAASLAAFSRKAENSAVISKKLYNSLIDAKNKIKFIKNVRIIESSHVDIPVTYGLFNPKIVIPIEMAESISNKKLTMIIMHELTHIKRGDIFKNYLWLAAKALHWFNPLVWLAYRAYLRDMELICDSKVIEHIEESKRTEYSQSLLEAARLMKRPKKASSVMLSFCENGSKLRRRIMNIIQPAKNSRKQIILIGIITVLLVVGCFTTACSGNQEEETVPIISTMDNTDNQAEDAVTETINSNNNSESNPYTWSQTQSFNDFEVTVNVDLDSENIPDRTTAPIIKLKSSNIDNDTVKKAAEYFLNDEYYSPVLTKADYQKNISDIKEAFSSIDIVNLLQTADEITAELSLKMETAPKENIKMTQDQIVMTQNSYSFEYGSASNESVYIKSYNENGDIMQLGAVNYNPYESVLFFLRDRGKYEYAATGSYASISEGDLSNDYSFYDDAFDMAKAAAGEMAENMVLYSAEYGVGANPYLWQNYEESDVIAGSRVPCFRFVFIPSVDGISSLRIYDSKEAANAGYLFATEYIEVIIDNEGLAELWWHKSFVQDSYVKEDAKVITAQMALDVFKENIFSTSEWDKYALYSCEVDITNLKFGMIALQDENGLRMVPAYIFSGKYTNSAPILYDGAYHYGGGKNMIINALNGRIIDFN